MGLKLSIIVHVNSSNLLINNFSAQQMIWSTLLSSVLRYLDIFNDKYWERDIEILRKRYWDIEILRHEPEVGLTGHCPQLLLVSCKPVIEGSQMLLLTDIWTNTFGNLDKYIWNLDKYIWQFAQIYLAIWTNTFGNLDKCIW